MNERLLGSDLSQLERIGIKKYNPGKSVCDSVDWRLHEKENFLQ